MTFTSSVQAYTSTAMDWLKSQIRTTDQTMTARQVQAPICTPTSNTTGNTISYKSTGALSKILGVEAEIPGEIVTDIGKGFAQAAMIAAIGYFIIKKI